MYSSIRRKQEEIMRKLTIITSGLLLLAILMAGCDQKPTEPGTLKFYSTGGDPVFIGMVSKDGWKMVFNHFYVTMKDITAYQTDPPYDPIYSADIIRYETSVTLDGTYTVDIAQGDGRRLVAELTDAPPGLFNAVSWIMTPGTEGAAADYAIVMVGQAAKNSELIDFTIKLNYDNGYQCGEYFVAGRDAADRLGQLESGGTAEVEMTYAIGYIFGDGSMPATAILNNTALGFDPLAALAVNGVLDIDQTGLENQLSADDYLLLTNAFPELGKVGVGRCFFLTP
jgi:hypothetical protein